MKAIWRWVLWRVGVNEREKFLLLAAPFALLFAFPYGWEIFNHRALGGVPTAGLSGADLMGPALALLAALHLGIVNLLTQNHPNHARLVPRQAFALRRALLSATLTSALLALGVCRMVSGQWLGPASPMLLALILLAPMAQRRLWLMILMGAAFPLILDPDYLWRRLQVEGAWSWVVELGLGGLALGLAALCLRWQSLSIGLGEASHRRRWAEQQGRLAPLRTTKPVEGWVSRLMAGLSSIICWPLAWQRRRLTLGRPWGSALTRLELTLWAPSLHPWLILVWAVYLMLFILSLDRDHAQSMMVVMVSMAGLLSQTARLKVLERGRFEQAVLLLLPGVPQGGALTRILLWRQWAVSMLSFVMVTAVLAWQAEFELTLMRGANLGVAGVLLLVVATALREPGSTRLGKSGADRWVGVSLVALLLSTVVSGLGQGLLAAGAAGFVLLSAHYGWRLVHARPMLPLGRTTALVGEGAP
ncbi:hypothetical protein HNQ51_000013 [Inhella inkyongensis]|uniref:Uncharacterized protein n=1 Tax=Inhella inkyongensis TaxID=392593 RepID=A0A840S296_9BURK|nr:hypothetical protein [Inhella inkyongensis]MBB5202720.1 hypothetical protein [Inhella inkyongensis]